MAGLLHGAEQLKCKTDQTYLYGLVCFVIRSERRKILKRRELSVKMKIRKGEICRYTGALGLEVLDRRPLCLCPRSCDEAGDGLVQGKDINARKQEERPLL